MMGKEHSGLDDAFMVLLLGGMSANHGRHGKGTGCNRRYHGPGDDLGVV